MFYKVFKRNDNKYKKSNKNILRPKRNHSLNKLKIQINLKIQIKLKIQINLKTWIRYIQIIKIFKT